MLTASSVLLRSAAALTLYGLATLAAAESPEIDRSLDARATGVTIPGSKPLRPARPAKPVEQTAVLRDLPPSIVHIAKEQGWAVARQPRAVTGAIGPGAGGAAYVERIAVSTAAPTCRAIRSSESLSDYYDFRPLARGFRVVDIRVEPLSPSFPLDVSPTASITYTHSNVHATPSVKQFDGIYVLTKHGWRKPSPDPRLPVTCWSGYRLHITVRGPADVDPLTGNPIRRTPVN